MPEKNSQNLYHFQGDKNLLDDTNELQDQINNVSDFLLKANSLRSSNLALFIGSGCSTPAIPQMGNTMQTMLAEDENIKQKVKEFIEDGDTSKFSDIEGLLNWLQNGIQYTKDQDIKKELESLFNKIKSEFIKTIPKYESDKYASDTFKLYSSFYEKVFSLRAGNENKLSIFTTNYDHF